MEKTQYLQVRVSNSHHPSSEFGLGRKKHMRKIFAKDGERIWGRGWRTRKIFAEEVKNVRGKESVLCDQFYEREEDKSFPHIIFNLNFFLNLKGHTLFQFLTVG